MNDTRTFAPSLFLTLAVAALGCSSADPQPTVPAEDPALETAEAPAEEATDPHAGHDEHEAESEPVVIRELEDGSRVFGSEPSDREVVELAAIMAEPTSYQGQVVKTEGEVAQVCQRMGCWMELRAEADGEAVRVPMAGHSFFLPRDIAGRRATVEGTVEVAELDADTREHLREEGAEAADQALSIQATAVVVH